MTLILSLANSQYIIQIGDRRITSLARPNAGSGRAILTEEQEKCGVLTCPNARAVFGFTGLARWKDIDIHRWACETLALCGRPLCTIEAITDAFQREANKAFRERLGDVSAEDRRTSFIFTGFYYSPKGYGTWAKVITNFQDLKARKNSRKAWDDFRVFSKLPGSPPQTEATLVEVVGSALIPRSELEERFAPMLRERKPPKFVVNRAIQFLREIADRKSSEGLIGKQLTTIVLPNDPRKGAEGGYESAVATTQQFFPAQVMAFPERQTAIGPVQFELEELEPVPKKVVHLPKVHRNALCPCGSGLRYKDCRKTHHRRGMKVGED